MEHGLKGRHVAIVAADGAESSHVTESQRALGDAGAVVDVLAARRGELRLSRGDSIPVERTFDSCRAADFDALVIPGGRDSIRALRAEPRAVQFVKEFMAADKPVAAIVEGVSMLVAADGAAGRAIAAADDAADDVRGAGAKVVDSGVHVDDKLITARSGQDLADLNTTMVREFANRVDEARVDQLSEQSFPASDPPPGPVAVGGEGASKTLHLDPGRRRPEGGDRGASS